MNYFNINDDSLFRAIFENAAIGVALIDTKTGKFVKINKKYCDFLGYSEEEMLSKTFMDVTHPEDVKPNIDSSRAMMEGKLKEFSYEKRYIRKDGKIVWGNLSLSPLWKQGETPEIFYHIAIVEDITKRVEFQEQLLEAKVAAESATEEISLQNAEIAFHNERLESLVRISQFKVESLSELLDFALSEAILLTQSSIGYVYLYNEDTQEFTLNSWSSEVMNLCKVQEKQTVYQLEKTGIWGEAVRQRKPILINDFEAENPLKKGVPEGHVELKKFLTIPVFNDGKIVAVIGVANKNTDYNAADVRQLNLLMSNVWKIYESKKYENQLKIEREQFLALLNAIPEPIYVCEIDSYKILFANKAKRKTFGDDIIGKKCYEIFHQSDKPCEFCSNPRLDLKQNDTIRWEKFYKTVQKHYLNIDKLITWHNGKLAKFQISFDLTDLKNTQNALIENEQRLKEAQQIAHMGNWELDFFNNSLCWSDEIYRILDCLPQEFKPSYQVFLEFVHPDDRKNVDFAYINSVKTHTPYEIEHRIITKQGKIKFVLERCHTTYDYNGNPAKSFGVIIDITQQKEIQEQLKQLNATKDKLFSIIAHDLKNPFAGILSSCELLLNYSAKFSEEKKRNLIEMIHSSTLQAHGLLINLLDWSRSQIGTIPFNPTQFNLFSLIEKTIKLVDVQAKNKQITIYNHCPNEFLIFADEGMISVVIRNLISNAIKFTPKGGEVFINASIQNDYHLISIRDTGVGISKERIENLFSIASKNSTKGTNNEFGTGLGLILCKEFVEKHGGKIWVESEEGKGSTFYFYCPI